MAMLLDARKYNPTSTLRESKHQPQFCGIYATIDITNNPSWGFCTAETVLLYISILADGVPVGMGNQIWRPSHVTRNGFDSESGIQITEHTFTNEAGITVCSLQLRNAGSYSSHVRVIATWNTSHPNPPICISNPAQEDMDLVLSCESTVDFTFTCSWNLDISHDRLASIAIINDPADTQRTEFEQWYQTNAAILASSNPYLERAWAFAYYLMWAAPTMAKPAPDDPISDAIDLYHGGDYTCPKITGPQTIDHLCTAIFGITKQTTRTLTLSPTGSFNLPDAVCIDDILIAGNRYSFVWDDPSTPTDYFDDGDKGFTVYHGNKRIFNASTITAFEYQP